MFKIETIIIYGNKYFIIPENRIRDFKAYIEFVGYKKEPVALSPKNKKKIKKKITGYESNSGYSYFTFNENKNIVKINTHGESTVMFDYFELIGAKETVDPITKFKFTSEVPQKLTSYYGSNII